MPTGPYVKRYSAKFDSAPRVGPLGTRSVIATVAVEWRQEIQDAIAKREALFHGRENQVALDTYHSGAAFSFNSLQLNELQRKINRAKLHLDTVREMASRTSKKWDEMLYEMHEWIYNHMHWDPIHVQKWVRDHATSAVIPGTFFYRSKHWPQLNDEELKYLLELDKGMLEWLLKDWDVNKKRIWKTNIVGRGSRARKPEISGTYPSYVMEFDRTRGVTFLPPLSAAWPFISDIDKQALQQNMEQDAAEILGIDVYYPPEKQGRLWKTVSEDLNFHGMKLLSADGSNWETYSATVNGIYCEAVDDGVPQFMSGVAETSLNATIAMWRMVSVFVPNIHKMKSLTVFGDDCTIVGPEAEIDKVREIPEVWERDPLAERNHIMLGIVMLPQQNGSYKGTHPGIWRVTIDRADKKMPTRIGLETGPIENKLSEDAFRIYHETMSEGTINGEPTVDFIATKPFQDFEKHWFERDRYAYLAEVAAGGFEVVPEDYEYPETENTV